MTRSDSVHSTAMPDAQEEGPAAASEGRRDAATIVLLQPERGARPHFVDEVAQAAATGDVLASSGIDHRDGTISYADASGRISRRPLSTWISFAAMQMHGRIRSEMARQTNLAQALPDDAFEALQAKIRRELRADTVQALAFGSRHAAGSEQDAELLALAPEWEAARDAYDRASSHQSEVEAVARRDDPPGPAPDGSGAVWEEWFARAEQWRARTGVDAAEEASRVACRALGAIEDRIAALPAHSLASLRLKVLVAQRCDDIELDWPEGLGSGLTRDLLALTAEPDVDWYSPPLGFMASPAIDPMCFLRIPQGLQVELQRLRTIAWSEFRRRTACLHEVMSEDEAEERRAAIRAELYLPALTAAVNSGSAEAATLAALGRPVGPDPALEAIDRHRIAYALYDQATKAEDDPGADAARVAELSRREIAAYDGLFAIQPTTLPGLAALVDYLREAVDKVRVDADPSDGERAFPVIANAIRAILATREERARHKTNLVDMLDLASATMDELQIIGELAERIGAVAYAHSWGPRCHLGTGRYGQPEHNDAGKLMLWLGDALTDVETAVDREVARRAPADSCEREMILSMRARLVIDNGDPEQIEAFARDLLDHAAGLTRSA